MEIIKSSEARSIVILYGITLGMAHVLHALLILWSDATSEYGSLVTHLLMFTVTFMALHEFRKANQGVLFRPQGWKIGILINVVSGFLFSIYTYFHIQYFDEEQVKVLLQSLEKQVIETPSLTETEKNIQLSIYRHYIFTPLGLSVINLLSNLIFGFLVTVLATVFLRKSRIEDEE